MERFVQSIVAGGIALVAGLWLVELREAWSPAWLVGLALVLAGIVGLAVGTWLPLER